MWHWLKAQTAQTEVDSNQKKNLGLDSFAGRESLLLYVYLLTWKLAQYPCWNLVKNPVLSPGLRLPSDLPILLY